jgi:tRNA(Ile)-lysidine synthase
MEKKVKEILRGVIKPTDKLVVAVSGGVDSVVLLHLLSKYTNNLFVAHLNHGLRKESVWEEQFVTKLAKGYQLPIFVKRLKLKSSSEESARLARYRFLRKIMASTGSKYIVCAHHLDDQIETLLLNLVRGVGPLEMWGMKEIENDIYRPLLPFEKKDIIAYAKAHKLKYVTDKSNFETKYTRNRIRAQVLPVLEKINPALKNTLRKELTLGDDMARTIDHYVIRAQKRVKDGNTINTKKLFMYPLYIQKEVLMRALHEMTSKKEGIYSKNIDELLKLARTEGNKKTSIRGFTIQKQYDKIIFDFKAQKAQKSAKIVLDKAIVFNGHKLTVKFGTALAGKNNILLPRSYAYNLNVRTWRVGDRINTKSGTKKLQDIFTDAKITASNRKSWPVVLYGSKIIWVPGLSGSKVAKSKVNNGLIIKVGK